MERFTIGVAPVEIALSGGRRFTVRVPYPEIKEAEKEEGKPKVILAPEQRDPTVWIFASEDSGSLLGTATKDSQFKRSGSQAVNSIWLCASVAGVEVEVES